MVVTITPLSNFPVLNKQLLIYPDRIEEKDKMISTIEGGVSGVGIKIHGIVGIVDVYPARFLIVI